MMNYPLTCPLTGFRLIVRVLAVTGADRYKVAPRQPGRTVRACIALAGLVGLVVAAPQEAAASAGGTRADRHAVRSGDARFEVLSPTLIRMEYAGDGKFTDAATF